MSCARLLLLLLLLLLLPPPPQPPLLRPSALVSVVGWPFPPALFFSNTDFQFNKSNPTAIMLSTCKRLSKAATNQPNSHFLHQYAPASAASRRSPAPSARASLTAKSEPYCEARNQLTWPC
jgi:hypothetical protein